MIYSYDICSNYCVVFDLNVSNNIIRIVFDCRLRLGVSGIFISRPLEQENGICERLIVKSINYIPWGL